MNWLPWCEPRGIVDPESTSCLYLRFSEPKTSVKIWLWNPWDSFWGPFVCLFEAVEKKHSYVQNPETFLFCVGRIGPPAISRGGFHCDLCCVLGFTFIPHSHHLSVFSCVLFLEIESQNSKTPRAASAPRWQSVRKIVFCLCFLWDSCPWELPCSVQVEDCTWRTLKRPFIWHFEVFHSRNTFRVFFSVALFLNKIDFIFKWTP